jgi:predicted Rossmann fold flavoprotein
VTCNNGRFRENLLFTHRGLSGPAMLQISSYWNGGDPVHINLLPDVAAGEWLASQRSSATRLDTLLAQRLPKRLAQQWCAAHDVVLPLQQLGNKRIAELATLLHDWVVWPSGTLGYNKAEVTLGGVDTRELSSKTMAATRVSGLHFIGEAVDVTGHLGGFNFQWAWASGHAAGEAV